MKIGCICNAEQLGSGTASGCPAYFESGTSLLILHVLCRNHLIFRILVLLAATELTYTTPSENLKSSSELSVLIRRFGTIRRRRSLLPMAPARLGPLVFLRGSLLAKPLLSGRPRRLPSMLLNPLQGSSLRGAPAASAPLSFSFRGSDVGMFQKFKESVFRAEIMRLCVVGLEPEFHEQCRVALGELAPEEWDLTALPHGAQPPEADVYIWEFLPGALPRPLLSDVAGRSLFVVAPTLLDEFREFLGPLRASILLKPVHPAALRPFLECSVRKGGSRPARPNDGKSDSAQWEGLLDYLLQANLKLQEYDQARTNFLARAVHDLRAPLTALGGYCGLLIEQRLGPLSTVQQDLLSRMQQSIRRVSGLADSMFELSVRRHARTEPDLQQGDMEGSIGQAIHEIAQHAEAKQLRVKVSVEGPEQPLVFDSAKIERVLVNLLENACKFTPKNGTIEVKAYPVSWHGKSAGVPQPKPPSGEQTCPRQFANAYRIDVRDSGTGIPPQHIETIFEEYTSYGGGQDRSGGGLGLAICRMMVDAHGGSIWADSTPAGTQFSLVLPHSLPVADQWSVKAVSA